MNQAENKFRRFRVAPIILEAFPASIALGGFYTSQEFLIIIGFCTASLMYMLLSWYYFKAEKFTVDGVIISTFSGMGISTILIGMLFFFLKWEQYEIMLISSTMALVVCSIVSIIYMVIRNIKEENRYVEFRMSQKLFSRFAILIVFFTVFRMYDSTLALFTGS